ncbi:hypothetical protein C8J36_110125 [Rhizobium sp. PP-F2F-G48]|uniref:HNH endonuclease signature motif containing protein n=1 Tax=Rhizobium sp. PP-F2F-G48 TaxID=2135651 RepID=UPI00104A433E|nr:HNH endonuclease signature motif containing protein [Rhizobium sp. PP-F2F-G48]TCM51118.1 hypothetical protein C8J36_110125 [Rhizobium sp. PP-F2F-G48]
MAEPLLSTIKRLFFEAGRRCAFPGCAVRLVDESGAIIGEICHMKARNAHGPRYDPSQSETERQSYDNLLLLCPTHHRTIDAQPEVFSVALLKDMKARAEADHSEPERPNDAFFAAALLAKLHDLVITDNRGNIAINSPGSVQAGTVVFKTTKSKPKIAAPAGSIGADGDRRRYVKYLIDRYIQFAKLEPSRSGEFKHAVIYASIKREFGSQWELVSLARFADLCVYLQARIAKTRFGRINAAKGQALFSSFEEYLSKHGG